MAQKPRLTHGRVHLLVLAAYSLLAVILTWPLAANLMTHIPGVPQWAFDESTFAWNIWYFKHALVDNLSSPLHSELIWYPLGIDLVLYTYNFYHVLAAMPLALAVNLPFANNLTLLTGTVLSAYGTWLLLLYLLNRAARTVVAGHVPRPAPAMDLQLAAFVGGLLYAYASNRAVYAALGHYDMVTTQWIPFYALMLLRALDGRLTVRAQRRAAIVAGLFFAFTGLAEMISALFLGIFTVIVLLVEAARRRRPTDEPRVALSRIAANLVILGVVAFIAWSPALLPILQAFRTADFDLQGWGDALALSADLFGWLTPTVFHPLFGGDIVEELRNVQLRALNPALVGFRDVNTVFLGWVSLALAFVGAFAYRRKVATWIWTSVLFGLFTLGPLLQINGRSVFDLDGLETTVPLPYIVLHFLPVVKANRAPNRNSVLLMLGLAVLAGYGAYWLLEKVRGWDTRRRHARALTGQPAPSTVFSLAVGLTAILLAGLVVFEHLALPAPLSDARVPGLYQTIAADPRPVSVLQAPLGWRNSFGVFGPERTQLQYYQSVHAKPMLGGNISRAPDFKMEYFRRIPYFHALTETEFGREVSPEMLEDAIAQADELVYLYNTGYVVLMPPIEGRLPYADTWGATWAFLKSTLPLEETPFWAQDGIEAYRVLQPEGGDRFALDLGVAGTFPYRGEGWDATETDAPYDATAIWATDRQSILFMPLRQVNPDAQYTIQMRVHPFVSPGSAAQTVTPTINGQRLETKELADDWQEVTWQMPGNALRDGLNRLALDWTDAVAPRAVLPGDRLIGATGIELPVDADLKAFADGGFIALFDEMGEQTDASAGRRGVNVTVLDPQDGTVRAQRGFDTAANATESTQLASFLGELEPGVPVLVASYGDASAFLTDEAIDALRSIGAGVTLEDLSGQYFAIAGVKGAEPGTAAWIVDPVDAFLRVSLNRDRRPLAAAVDWVEIGPAGE